MRQIILDVETTGLYPEQGHKIIEIGCVEVLNKIKTKEKFHCFINPRRDVPKEAFKIHGISTEFLKDKPFFKDIAKDFLDFLQDSELIIHNAPFDIKFINYELNAIGVKPIGMSRVVDTLLLARSKFPGSPASLDALCKRFKVNLSEREKRGHGALLDSELLYHVYIYLTEGVQSELLVKKENKKSELKKEVKEFIEPRQYSYAEDFRKHLEFIGNIPNSIWKD